jgi:hypothetical protein
VTSGDGPVTAQAGRAGREGLPGPLPEVIVIGAMKCATTAVHAYLDAHPDISMSRPKELNFFNGPSLPPHDDAGSWWRTGQWHRGLAWYSSQFDARARVRGESSPAYTAPDSREVPERMAGVVPGVRLVYLVRDPVARAVSQYAHHRRDGTEPRPLEEALLDPGSQYISRSRYHERLVPFLEWFPREQVLTIVQERLAACGPRQLSRLYEHVGVDPGWRDERHARRGHAGDHRHPQSARLRAAFLEQVEDDVARLRQLLDDELAEWS